VLVSDSSTPFLEKGQYVIVASKTKVHAWVKHIVVPVQVVPTFEEGEDGIYAVADPEVQKQSEDNAVFGCQDCGALLTYATSTTDCPGKDEHAPA
jgi:hypothetical protein